MLLITMDNMGSTTLIRTVFNNHEQLDVFFAVYHIYIVKMIYKIVKYFVGSLRLNQVMMNIFMMCQPARLQSRAHFDEISGV